MTKVEFVFYDPDGDPVANKEFEIRLPRAGFVPKKTGVVVPETLTATTGSDGKVIVELAPSSSPYFVTLYRDPLMEDCCDAERVAYRFYVPDSTEILRAQDLFLDPMPSSLPYDEAALLVITEAKGEAIAAAVRAEFAADNAEDAEVSAEADALIASNAAAAALVSKNAAKVSETAAAGSAGTAATLAEQARVSSVNSGNSATAAATSATAALASKNDAATSATAALGSKNAAATSATTATTQATAATSAKVSAETAATTATTKASEAVTSASNAATSATNAKTSETNAANSATAAAAALANKQDKHVNLTALSALTGAAGRVPVFTAAGAMSTVDVTATPDPKVFSLPATSLTRVAEAVHAALSQFGFYSNDNSINIDSLPGGWCGLVSVSLGGVMPPLAGGFFWLSCQQTYSGQSQLQTAVQYGGSATDPTSVSLAPGVAIRIRNQPGTAWGPWGKTLSSRDTVASNLDQTAGKVLTVGYQGLGADAAPALLDMNLPFGSGFSWATSGTANFWPGFASGSNFITSSASIAEVAQIGFSRTTPLRVAARRKTSGSWQGVVEFIHTGNVNNDPALGTGGVMFYGSNANGNFTKHADGTLECWFYQSAIVDFVAIDRQQLNWTFPATFVGALPFVNCQGGARMDGVIVASSWQVYGQTFTAVTCAVQRSNGGTLNSVRDVAWYAKGRWKV